MKTSFKLIVFWCAIGIALVFGSSGNANPNDIAANTFPTGTNDLHRVIQSLSEIEKLWPQKPEEYFKSVKAAVGILGVSLNEPAAGRALSETWTNVFRKKLPQEDSRGLACLNLKTDVIFNYRNYEGYIYNRNRWVDIARFIGEIRSREIPNYHWQSYMVSRSDEAAYWTPERIAEHERFAIADHFQAALIHTSSLLTVYLLEMRFKEFADYRPGDTNFIQSLLVSAHLTPDEIKSLNEKMK
jgi:hypothetical protein